MEQEKLCSSFDVHTNFFQLSSKMLKKDVVLGSKPMLFQTKHNLSTPNSFLANGQLGFSPLTKPEGLHLSSGNDSCSKISGTPFTPSQWRELDHQASIFKYMIAGIPVPPNLVLPLRRTIHPSLYSFSSSSLSTNPLRWGSFHLGFSGNLDPEPGRCRRTDGKKWRCAREAARDQKYCERHLNRSRQRSRKPVEGQTGQNTTATTAGTAASKASAVTVAGSLTNTLPRGKTTQPSAGLSSAANFCNGFLINKTNLEDSMHLFSVNAKVEESMVAQKQQLSSSESTRDWSSFDSSYSQRNPSFKAKKDVLSSDVCTTVPEKNDYLGHFIDQWPKIESLQPERTTLSIYVDPITPMAPMAREKLTFSELTLPGENHLSREMGFPSLGLGVGAVDDSFQRQSDWKTLIGGPLAEMLNSTSSNGNELEGYPALNLMTHGWDGSSPLGSLPTGVLRENAFGSISSSSTGSSPRAAEISKRSALLS